MLVKNYTKEMELLQYKKNKTVLLKFHKTNEMFYTQIASIKYELFSSLFI